MASLLKKTETPSVGQVREEPVLAPELESVANGEASIGVEQPHFKTPVQESTPHDDMVVLTVAVKQSPVPKPEGDDECPDRTAHGGEPPIHVHSAGQSTKLIVQETGKGADQEMSHLVTGVPSTKSYTKGKDSYESEVVDTCSTIFQKFPKALGLIVLFACSEAARIRNLPRVPGVMKGVDKMIETFRFLGYAVLHLPGNLANWHYRAAMKAVASVSFPESYRHIFVYYTGHGGKDFIDTPNGSLTLVDITNPFSPKQAPRLELLTKIFIFDTCSSLSELHSIFPNSVLLFPAHPGYPAVAKPGDCGLLTQHLAPALRTSSKSFGEIVIDVTDTIKTEVKNDPRLSNEVPLESQPLLCQTLKSHVCLVQERMEAMTPSIIIQKIGPTSISVAISLPPSSAQFDLQHLQLSYKCEGAEDWTSVDHFDNVLGGTVVINNLSHGKRYTVKAVAVYPDDEKISSQEEPCDMPTEVEPVLNQVLDYCHVDSVEFEVCRPAKRDEMEWFEVVCQCEETQELKPVEWPENDDRVRISELEPGVRYTVKATAHYPNQQSVSVTKSFEIPKHDVTPNIERSKSQQPTCRSVTVSVTAPPQPDKYHLKSLSAKLWRKKDEELWRANEGELQSQAIRMDHDQREESVTFCKLSPSTTYVAKAIATYDGNKVVSSDPITIATSSVPYCKILLSVFLCLGFLLSLAFLGLYQQDHVQAVPKFGLQGDTIVASDFHSFGSAAIAISECPEEGDDPHSLKAALVKKSDIIVYMENNTGTINSSATGRVSLLEDMYFLQESLIAVNICLSSQYSPLESSRSVPVFAFVFDSSDDNQKFLMNETDGIHSSLYHKALQVGSISKPICTWVNYSVASPAYYYLTLGEYALGRLAYGADLYLLEKYLNFSDYEGSEQYCSSVSETQPCTLALHKRVERKEYFLVTYICSRPSSFSDSTHVCAKFHQSAVVVIVPRLLTVFLFLILTLVIAVDLYKCVKKHGILHRCHGYKPVPNNVV